jgi:2-dehydropantoate 2-reductase
MKIAVMGAGSMGGYLGGRLAQAGRDVTFIARGRHLRAIQENGLHVQSPAGDFVVKPAAATDDPKNVGPVDLILLCVKSYDVLNAAQMLQPVVAPQTVLIPVQNGIGHIELISRVLGAEHVLGGVSLISARISAPGTIQRNPGSDTLEFGEMEGGHSARCEMIEAVLAVDGIKASARPDIAERMWWKLAAYSGVGVFCVVRGERGAIWATRETKELYRQAIAEAVTVAQAKGIPLTASVPDEHVAILDTFPPDWRPSMLVALEQGRRLELESLHGAICAMGKEAGVPTPINDFIYACLKPYIHGRPQLESNQ